MEASSRIGSAWTIFRLLAVALILRFLWKALVPGGEWPLPPFHYIAMGLDFLMWLALAGLRQQVLTQMPLDDPRQSTLRCLYWPAFAAAILLLLIRFTSEAAWWTGHLQNGLISG